MREILFKAKRCDNGKWVEGLVGHPHVTDTEKGVKSYYFHAKDEMDFWSQCIVSAETICQYTGLTDKNGNKIFENDIIGTDVGNVKVAYVTDPSPYENHHNAGFEVLFYSVTDNENYRHDLGYWVFYRDFVVVGNTIDNPELMSGTEF